MTTTLDPRAIPEGPYLTAAEAAAELFLNRRTVEQWAHRGLVTSYRGLFCLPELLEVEARTRRRPRLEQLVGRASGDVELDAAG